MLKVAHIIGIIALAVCSINVWAVSKIFKPNMISSQVKVVHTSSVPEATALSNLDSIDNDSADLNALNRKLVIEKAQSELKRVRNSDNHSGSQGAIMRSSWDIQTIVTGVAINLEGKKIAWLQFADGGTLLVNIGSNVGKYTVSNISMTGVTLSTSTLGRTVGSKQRGVKNIYLKRVYASDGISKTNMGSSDGSSVNPFFSPSSVVTGANATDTSNVVVPPIISTR